MLKYVYIKYFTLNIKKKTCMAWPSRIWGIECKCCYDTDTWSIDLRPLQATIGSLSSGPKNTE